MCNCGCSEKTKEPYNKIMNDVMYAVIVGVIVGLVCKRMKI